MSGDQITRHEVPPLHQISSTKGKIQLIQQLEIDLQFEPENIDNMDRFDVRQIYSNKNIYGQNRARSDFIFLLQLSKRGSRHLISIQKSQIVCTLIKLLSISIICFYLFSWIDTQNHLYPGVKQTFLWSFKLTPLLLFLVMTIDPGYVLNHEIYEQQYERTQDKKRPKDGKYCEYCKIFIKRKTNHCFRCNHCVASFDHHCGVMARCVGRSNFILFYTFVFTANLLYMGIVILVFYIFVLA